MLAIPAEDPPLDVSCMESNILVEDGEINVALKMFVSNPENAHCWSSQELATNVPVTLTETRISDNVSDIFLDPKKSIAPLDNFAINVDIKEHANTPVCIKEDKNIAENGEFPDV
jgi:hypothetical protein